MNNRRKFERYPVDAPARITLIGSRGKAKTIDSHIDDLSAVGGFFPDAKSLPVGQRLEVDIFLPFERSNFLPGEYDLITMTVTGDAIRSGPSGTAVAFNDEYRLASRKICAGMNETVKGDLKKKKDDQTK